MNCPGVPSCKNAAEIGNVMNLSNQPFNQATLARNPVGGQQMQEPLMFPRRAWSAPTQVFDTWK